MPKTNEGHDRCGVVQRGLAPSSTLFQSLGSPERDDACDVRGQVRVRGKARLEGEREPVRRWQNAKKQDYGDVDGLEPHREPPSADKRCCKRCQGENSEERRRIDNAAKEFGECEKHVGLNFPTAPM